MHKAPVSIRRVRLRGSHRPTTLTCDVRASPKCRQSWVVRQRLANEIRANNDGKIICVFCSRTIKFSGRMNPNTAYRGLDDAFFETVDTEQKAYLLGWIASDGAIGHGSIAIAIHEREAETLRRLRDVICPELPVRARRGGSLVVLTISSRRISADVCRLLGIAPGKKDAVVRFPELASDGQKWAFLRGYFDGDGSISSLDAALKRARGGMPMPRCSLASTSALLLDSVQSFCGVPAYRGSGVLEWTGTNAIDFMGKLYDRASIYLSRKRDLYFDWCHWVPGLSGGRSTGRYPLFRWIKSHRAAVPPSKVHTSDSGFDLTLIEPARKLGMVQFYRTGIKVQPAPGWYFDVVPRSSIAKTGYVLANSIGVIDRGYVGEIQVPLIKMDPDAPELVLPARIVQLIPRPIIAARLEEAEDLPPTPRCDGGFGSTG